MRSHRSKSWVLGMLVVGVAASMPSRAVASIEMAEVSKPFISVAWDEGLFKTSSLPDGLAVANPFPPPSAGIVEDQIPPAWAERVGGDPASGSLDDGPPSTANEEEAGIEDEGLLITEYDPWEPFNEVTFSVNLKLDRFVVKPVATVWDAILPDLIERSLDSAFDNLGMPRRLVNSLFQFKIKGATREVARFILNSTIGIAGLFDFAKLVGIEESDEDAGQTLGVYGIGPGPYLILPLFPPLTVRDGIGKAIDGVLDPLNYLLPGEALLGIGLGERVNDRALNLEFFETVEETALDLYSAVRNGYLQRRQKQIEE